MRMRAAGDLGDEVRVTVERGARNFASGDRVMFLQNERGLGVKNGTLGTIEQVSAQSMTVQTDDGRSVQFDLKDYNKIDHGYAATIHKAQGMTVDRAHVLATPGMDAHRSYVALSRHRDGVELHYGRDDFANPDRLTRTLSRDRAKDMASDYEQRRSGAKLCRAAWASPSASAWPRSCARSCRRRCATCSTAFALLQMCLARMADGGRSGKRRKGKGAVRQPSGAKPNRRKGRSAEEAEKEMRRLRTRALVRHAQRRGCDLRYAGAGLRCNSRAGEGIAAGP